MRTMLSGCARCRAVEQVEHHSAAEPGGADAEAGVAERRRPTRPPCAVPKNARSGCRCRSRRPSGG